MNTYWLSWYTLQEEIDESCSFPCWWTGFTWSVFGDGAQVHIFCAAVDAKDEAQAWAKVSEFCPVHDRRFSTKKALGWRPPEDRFPEAVPLEDAHVP